MAKVSVLKIFGSNRGSALLPVLIISGAVVATSLALLSSSSHLSKLYNQKSYSQAADNIANVLGTIAVDPQVCLNGFTTGEKGILFSNGTGAYLPVFSLAGAAGANQLDITLPSSYPASTGGHRRFAANFTLPESNLKISRLYATNAVQGTGTVYTMDLMADLQPAFGSIALSPRKVGSVQITTDASGNVTACGPSPTTNSNQALCVGMNCTYSVSPSGQASCQCPIQPVTCSNGRYIASIVNYVPQCSTSTVSRSCSTYQSGYLVALDSSGNPVCGQVYSCPAGTGPNGLGGPANPAECKCANAGETWATTSSTCIPSTGPLPAVNGACGAPPNGGSYPDAATANAAGPLCSAGTPSVASLSGAGPWSWTCSGANGGSPSGTCSASVAPASTCASASNTTLLNMKYCGHVANSGTAPDICITVAAAGVSGMGVPYGYGPYPPVSGETDGYTLSVTFNWDVGGTPVTCVSPSIVAFGSPASTGTMAIGCGASPTGLTMTLNYFATGGTKLSSTWAPGGGNYAPAVVYPTTCAPVPAPPPAPAPAPAGACTLTLPATWYSANSTYQCTTEGGGNVSITNGGTYTTTSVTCTGPNGTTPLNVQSENWGCNNGTVVLPPSTDCSCP